MKSHELSCDPELAALFERAKVIEPVPDVVRARMLARARAVVATSEAFPAQPVPPPARHHRLQFAIAALVAFVVGAASAAAALRRPQRAVVAPTIASSARAVPSARIVKGDSRPVPRTVAEYRSSTTAKPRRPARPTTAEESYAAELDLLQRAQGAYASRNFAVALALLAEHGRLFPKGRLAEEREALRVRSLARSGHPDDARRVAAAFADRFPRSVLLQQLQETVPSPE